MVISQGKSLMQQYSWETRWPSGQRAGLRIERSGFEPWPGHCVVSLGKALYSHSASLHPGVNGYQTVRETR